MLMTKTETISYGSALTADIADLSALLTLLFTIEQDFNPDLSKQHKGLELLLQNANTANIGVARNAAGKVIGMVTAQLVISTAQGAASAWVEDMVVAEDYRGRGVGKQLLKNAQAWAKSQGATRLQLLVDTSNSEALAYYAHLNWQSTQLQARRIFI
jgi:GNAT superfamily N-acetyltransferase